MRAGDVMPDALLDRLVSGVNLVPGTLRDQLGNDLRLLVFLRHFGCLFCRETLSDMRAVCESDRDFPAPLFFYQGTPTEGRAFLRRYWPELRAVSDPTAEFYEAFGIRRGGLLKMLGPAVWSAKSRAAEKGHRNGERVGDIWRMPGMYLVRGKELLWAHEYRHAADHPDYGSIRDLAAGARRHVRGDPVSRGSRIPGYPRRATVASTMRSSGTTIRTPSRPGATDAPDTRSSTPACASSARRAGCTTGCA